VAGGPFDFRDPRPVAEAVLDTAFTDLAPEADGRWRMRLTRPSSDRVVTVWGDPAYRWVQVFTGDTLAGEQSRRSGLAVEPMTCPPNALATGQDLLALEPGQAWSAPWGISTS